MIVEFLKNTIKLALFGRFSKYLPAFFDKMLTLGNQRASSHGSRLIAFFDKMLTLGHQQASLHGSRSIAFLHRSDFGDVGGSETRLCAKDHASTSHGSRSIAFLMEKISNTKAHQGPSKRIFW